MWQKSCTLKSGSLVSIFITKPLSVSALKTRMALLCNSHKYEMEGIVKSYCRSGNSLPQTYTKDNEIATTDAILVRCTQPSNNAPTMPTEAFWGKPLRCNIVYGEYVLQ